MPPNDLSLAFGPRISVDAVNAMNRPKYRKSHIKLLSKAAGE